MRVSCPNCGLKFESQPVTCPRCGYHSDLAREYLWLYVSGILILLCGFAFGTLSVFVAGLPGSWSRALVGWFSLNPWPSRYHWLSFLTAGILLSLAGAGITRHWRHAIFLFVVLFLWEMFWTVSKLFTGEPGEPVPVVASLFLTLETVGILLSIRLLRARDKIRPRDVSKLQARTSPSSEN